MNTQLVEILERAGLNSKEAKVYLSLVQAGQAQVSKIATLAKINRITTYDILDKLKKKGLSSSFVKNKVRYFNATKPDIVVNEFEKRAQDLKNALPKFREIMGEETGAKIRHLEGIEGVKSIYLESLTVSGDTGSEILAILNNDKIYELWPEFERDYLKKKAKKQIFSRIVSVDTRDISEIKAEDSKFYQETRLIPKGFRFSGCNILLYKGKACIVSLGDEITGVVFESGLIVQSFLSMFEMMWQFCGKGPISIDPAEIKNKMFEPLSGDELARSISEMSKPLSHEKKDEKDDNLRLF